MFLPAYDIISHTTFPITFLWRENHITPHACDNIYPNIFYDKHSLYAPYNCNFQQHPLFRCTHSKIIHSWWRAVWLVKILQSGYCIFITLLVHTTVMDKSFLNLTHLKNKIGMVSSWVYTNIPKVFFNPRHIGHCNTNVNQDTFAQQCGSLTA